MSYWFEILNDNDILKYVVPEWKNYVSNQMQFLRSKSFCAEDNKSTAYYSSFRNQMFFPKEENANENVYVVFHEYGHLIHHNAFDYYRINNTISSIFKKEVQKKKIINEEIGLKFLNNLKKEFAWGYANSLCPISDALGNYFDTNLFYENGYRSHKKGYASCSLGTELFAEIFQMTVMGDSKGLRIFKREFPKTYYYLSEKINGLRK